VIAHRHLFAGLARPDMPAAKQPRRTCHAPSPALALGAGKPLLPGQATAPTPPGFRAADVNLATPGSGRIDAMTETFTAFLSGRSCAPPRQMVGINGEALGNESGSDRILRIEYGV
jgi:hypothetical protein